MPVQKYNVVIVGAGPAGFNAARACGEAGLSVALVEQKKDVTKFERSCAQTFVSYTEPYMKNLISFNQKAGLVSFLHDGFSVKYTGPYRNIYAWFFYSPAGYPVRLGNPDKGRQLGDAARAGIVIDKESLFKDFVSVIKSLGVEVFPGVHIEKAEKTDKGARVIGRSGESFEGRYVIAADGVNSRIAEELGWNKDRYYWCNLITTSYYFKGVKADPNTIVTSTGFFKDGTALFFMAPRPFNDEWNVQFLTVNPNVSHKEAAEFFFKQAFTSEWFKNAKQLKMLSRTCSCYDPIGVPFKDNFLAIGDTGSTQEIENTGALMCGWKGGQAIAQAIREEQLGLPVTGINDYLHWWKETYVEGYSHEAYMKNWVLGFVLNKAEDMSYVFGLVKDELPANFNPYSAPKMMGRTLGALGPTIAKERPDLLPKMGKLRLPLKEVYAEVTRISKPVVD
ncbi:MAG: FAD-dependent monooxygenase [Chloroflexota bacterium]